MNKIKKANIQNNKELKFSLIVIVLTLLCSFLIVIATFTQLNIFTVENWNLKQMYYIPQIPVILFISGLLGKKYGTLSIIFYIITGLFLVPIFSLGGGLDYILNFNFGYILAFIPAVYLSAKLIEQNSDLLHLVVGNIIGVITIHIIGIIYLTSILLLEKESFIDIYSWITNQSLNTILIDLLFGFAGIVLGNTVKNILKKVA